MVLAVIASAQPLDTYRCDTCDPRADQFRSGDYSTLPYLIIDPACDCPFPNNFIPQSRLLPNGAWPEDIYRRNSRAFFSTEGRVARVVAQGFTPLLEALRWGSSSHPRRHLHPEELESLLEGLTQAEVNARVTNLGRFASGRTALHWAALRSGPGLLQLLLDSGATIDARSDRRFTPLMYATTTEHFDTLRAAGADIRAQGDAGFTVLHRAAHFTDAATVEALIASGLDPDGISDWVPLHTAGSPETFEALRKAGADIHARTDLGFTVLHRAAGFSDAATVESLIAAGLDPNAETSDGRTPLLYARLRGTFEALLAGGAGLGPIEAVFAPDGGRDAYIRGEISGNVLTSAVQTVGRFASTSLVAQLRAVNPGFAEVGDRNGYVPLYFAVASNEDPAMVAALSTSNVNATALPRGGVPLHLAARSNSNPAVIEALLDAGARVQVNLPQYGSSGGPTPVYLAASNGSPRAAEIVSVLLAAGADANGRDENGEDTGYAPLYAAAVTQNVAAMELLLAAGANANGSNNEENTGAPLYAAAMVQNLAAMELLLEAGADVNITGSSDYQSLLADVLGRGRYDCGYAPVADVLRAAGATSWRIVGDQRMPYVSGPPVAECETVSEKAQALIDSGEDLDALDSNGFACMHLAAADGKVADIRALAAAGANVNAATRGGRLTPLHVAVWRRAGLATVQALIAVGTDVDAVDWFGRTALHRAAGDRRADPAVVAALLAAEADANAKDTHLRTPLHYATRADVKNEAVADLLRAAGGTCRRCVAP